MSKRTLNTVALFVLGFAAGIGLYGVASDSDLMAAMLLVAAIGFVLVVLARREGSAR